MRNPTYDQAIKGYGVQFTYAPQVNCEEIDWTKGLRNQARLIDPLDNDLVTEYATAMKEGAEFPPVVIYRPTPRSKYIPIDGNQRGAAKAKAGVKFTDAYVIDCNDPLVIDRMTWSFNQKVNGKRLSAEECMEHAISYVRKYGYKATDAAKEWSVNKVTLAKNLRAREIRDSLGRQNVRNVDRLNSNRLTALAPLQELGEDVLAKAAEAAISTGINEKGVEDLVRKVKACRTSEDKMAAVEQFTRDERVQARAAETKGGTLNPKPRPSEKLASLMKQAVRLLEDFPDKKAILPTDKADFKKSRELAGDLTCRLIAIFGLGAMPEREAM